ncbi:MAG: hypothetical protein KAT05_14585 [Spirochaetes bacterium]|nr:hypothetical protein [Spirochaetota bacterium]
MKNYCIIFILLLLFIIPYVSFTQTQNNRDFWVRKADGSDAFYSISAVKLYSGKDCEIYVDKNCLSLISQNSAKNIANEYDKNIHQKIVNSFGEVSDIDQNGKVIILILDIIDNYIGHGAYVAGYFDPTHIFSKDTYSISNEADMIFVDCNPLKIETETFYITLAHEFQHLINFNVNYFDDGIEQDTWINEGLSSAAETIYSDKIIQWKVDAFNRNTIHTNLDIMDGAYFVKWTGALANYSTVYLFFQWLRIHSSNGVGIYKAINDLKSDDYKDIVDAANKYIDEYEVNNWKGIYRDWLVANVLNKSTGLYGYNGIISTNPQFYTNGGQISLDPSGAIYKSISTAYSQMTSGNIDYIGIDTSTSAIDITQPYEGDYLIAYNFNADPYGKLEATGSLPLGAIVKANNLNLDNNIPDLKLSYPMGQVFELVDTNKLNIIMEETNE